MGDTNIMLNIDKELNKEEIKEYLMFDSGLPGKRANLKKVEEFSELVEASRLDEELFIFIEDLWETDSDGNDKETMLVLSGLLASSHFYMDDKYRDRVTIIFKEAMNDSRWRVREIIQESFKVIARLDYKTLVSYFDSFNSLSPLEYRAIVTTLAHPEILKTEEQKTYSMKKMIESMNAFLEYEKIYDKKDDDFVALQKGLSFAISVIVSENSEEGVKILEEYLNKSKIMNKILKENLKKNRLIKNYSNECDTLIIKMIL